MKVVRNDSPSDHVNDVVSAHTGHHEPLIAHDEEHQVVHLVPFTSFILQSYNEACSNVARIEEIVRVMVDNYQRRYPRVAKQESIKSAHVEVFLNILRYIQTLTYLNNASEDEEDYICKNGPVGLPVE